MNSAERSQINTHILETCKHQRYKLRAGVNGESSIKMPKNETVKCSNCKENVRHVNGHALVKGKTAT